MKEVHIPGELPLLGANLPSRSVADDVEKLIKIAFRLSRALENYIHRLESAPDSLRGNVDSLAIGDEIIVKERLITASLQINASVREFALRLVDHRPSDPAIVVGPHTVGETDPQ